MPASAPLVSLEQPPSPSYPPPTGSSEEPLAVPVSPASPLLEDGLHRAIGAAPCKPADPEGDVSTVIDAQEEDLPPCGAAGKKRTMSDEKPTAAAVAMDRDQGGTCSQLIPMDDEFWVEFRKRQQFYRQLDLAHASSPDGRWL